MHMSWFFIALVAPFLWAIVNVADNYLVTNFSEKEKERSSGGLVLFSSLIGIFIAIFIRIFVSGSYDIGIFNILLLMLTGVMTIVWIILYLYALEIEDTSLVVPWFLTVPVFGYVFGYLFLGENLSQNQFIGSIVILVGVLLISIDWQGGNKNIFKKKPIIYMIFACLIVALSGIIFKYVTNEGSFWVSSFWEYFGLGIAGIFIYIFSPKHRNEFHFMNRTGGRKIFFVNIISELMTISGNLLTNFALLLAPVTMVYLVGSFQPVIVLFLAIIGTRFFPHLIKENISRRNLEPKIISILIITIGSIILFL